MSAHTPGPQSDKEYQMSLHNAACLDCYVAGDGEHVVLCPLHAAAPALLEALATMVAAYGHYDTQAVNEARAAIRAAKGERNA